MCNICRCATNCEMICSQVLFLFFVKLTFQICCDTFIIVNQLLYCSKWCFWALFYTSILETWFSYKWTWNIIVPCCQTWVLKIHTKWHFWSTPSCTLMSNSKIYRSNFSSDTLLLSFRISTYLWNSCRYFIICCSVLDVWVYFGLRNIKIIDGSLILVSRWFVWIQ